MKTMGSDFALFDGTFQLPYQVADCNQLRVEIQHFRDQLTELRADRRAAGLAYRERALQRRAELLAEIAKATDEEINAEVEQAIQAISLGLSWAFLGVGLVLASPLAIGLAIGLETFAGPALFAWQAIASRNPDGPALVFGYGADRALFISELVAAESGSSGGRIAARSFQAVAFLNSAWTFLRAGEDLTQAKAQLRLSRDALASLDSGLAAMDTNALQWAGALEGILQGGVLRLEKFVEENQASNCQVQAFGPTIKQG